MAFTEEEINEFKTEAEDLLDQGEKSLLVLEKGGRFVQHYDAIFRAFHSIKGAAGMMELTDLQQHMHQLENILTEQKTQEVLPKEYIDFFLRGSDACRQILNGKKVEFNYTVKSASDESKPTSVPDLTPAATVSVVSSDQPKALSGNSSGRILVVDDEPEIVELLEVILIDAGFEVMGTTQPTQALELIKKFKPNVVLSDISMPKISGLQLLAKITAYEPDLPVVFISGNVTKDSLVEAIKMGVFGVIEKPFNVARVIEIAHQAVNRNTLTKMVNESINLLMYQFSDLDRYLRTQGKEDVQRLISTQINDLLEQRRKMRDTRRTVDA